MTANRSSETERSRRVRGLVQWVMLVSFATLFVNLALYLHATQNETPRTWWLSFAIVAAGSSIVEVGMWSAIKRAKRNGDLE